MSWLVLGACQDARHFFVGDLAEVLVPAPDGVQRLGLLEAHELVDL